VSKLRELSGAQWVDDVCMISLEEDHYLGHIKVFLDAYPLLISSQALSSLLTCFEKNLGPT
jgi:hypothetical protein